MLKIELCLLHIESIKRRYLAMKRFISVLCCISLIFLFAGCSETEKTVKTVTEEYVKTEMEENMNQPEEKSVVSPITEVVSDMTMKESATEENLYSNTRSLKMNGKDMVAVLKEEKVSEFYGNKERNVVVFENEDKSVYFEFDKETDELLWARFKKSNVATKNITAEEARKLANAFISDNCSNGKTHTYTGIKRQESSGYFVSYTKMNDDYNLDGVTIVIRFDGTVGQYLLNTDVDTNTSINVDYDKTDKVVIKKVKEKYGNDIEFSIVSRSKVKTKDDGSLYVHYSVSIPEKSQNMTFGYDVTITKTGAIDNSVEK